jgi:hypothetical protein
MLDFRKHPFYDLGEYRQEEVEEEEGPEPSDG